MLVSVCLFSGLTSVSTVPAGSLSKAALVGAKTVNGPLLCSVSTSPAAFTAATSVVWSAEFTAFSTMFFVLYIGAPPTIGLLLLVPPPIICAASGIDTAATNISANRVFLIFIPPVSLCLVTCPIYGARRARGFRRRGKFLPDVKRPHHRVEEVFEHALAVLAEARVDGRGLDDGAARGD